MARNDHHASATVFGPFCRVEAPGGQTTKTAVLQALSGEVWGAAPRYGDTPQVQAFAARALKDGESGIEFWSFQPPDTRFGPAPYWLTPGDHLRVEHDPGAGRELAKLRVAFIRITQDLLAEAASK